MKARLPIFAGLLACSISAPAAAQLAVPGPVTGALVTPPAAESIAPAVGRLLYLVHLAVLLWWLLDKSVKQRATTALVALIQQILPSIALTLRLPPVRRFVLSADELVREGLFTDPAPA